MDHRVGRGQIEAGAARLEADQDDGTQPSKRRVSGRSAVTVRPGAMRPGPEISCVRLVASQPYSFRRRH
jgi:hypothetical protein